MIIEMKNSKYEGHERIVDYRNYDMKNLQSKKVDWENVGYGVIIVILAIMAILSWITVRDDHPFNEPTVQVRNDK